MSHGSEPSAGLARLAEENIQDLYSIGGPLFAVDRLLYWLSRRPDAVNRGTLEDLAREFHERVMEYSTGWTGQSGVEDRAKVKTLDDVFPEARGARHPDASKVVMLDGYDVYRAVENWMEGAPEGTNRKLAFKALERSDRFPDSSGTLEKKYLAVQRVLLKDDEKAPEA